MVTRLVKFTWNHVRYVPLWSALVSSHWRSFERRSRALGTAVGGLLRWYPIAQRRVDRELLRVYPNLTRSRRAKLRREIGRHMGQTLFEIYHCAEFQTRLDRFEVTGPGLTALEEARAQGKGAIVVSGHFGQWEAIRAVLKARGLESGAVYKPQTNPHYQRRLLAGIEAGGKPILATGRVGTKAMVRHLCSGGIISILLDEKYAEGVRLPFLGLPAMTSISAAQLALKYGLPMVPAYGTRLGDGGRFEVAFEAPIPHTDPVTMTRAFNDSLSARIEADPAQWYWLLRRWDGA
jgi:KDO2-lipid IV(A) lauroyltransferase